MGVNCKKSRAFYKGFSIIEYDETLAIIRYFKVKDKDGNIIEKMNNARAEINSDYKKKIDELIELTDKEMERLELKYV